MSAASLRNESVHHRTLQTQHGALRSGNLELDGDVVARRVRVRADLLVRLAGERGELGLGQAPVLQAELDREDEAAAVGRAGCVRDGDVRTGRVLSYQVDGEVS